MAQPRRPVPVSTHSKTPLVDEEWKDSALCAQRSYLPWVADIEPDEFTLREMRTLCANCPVIRDCALYALTSGGTKSRPGRGVHGGFYAGVWIPWRNEAADPETPGSRRRSAARRTLRIICGIKRKGSHHVITVYAPEAGPDIPKCVMCDATKRHLRKLDATFAEETITDEVRAAALELGLATSPVVCVSIGDREFFWGGHRPDKLTAAVAGDADKLVALKTDYATR